MNEITGPFLLEDQCMGKALIEQALYPYHERRGA